MDKNTLRLFQSSQSYLPDFEFLEFVGESSTTTDTLVLPSNTEVGDIVVITRYKSFSGLTPPSYSTPANFTLVGSATDTTYVAMTQQYYAGRLSTYFKVAEVAGNQSINIFSSGPETYCIVFRPSSVSYSTVTAGGASSVTVGLPFGGFFGETGNGSVTTNTSTATNPVAIIAYGSGNSSITTTGELLLQATRWYLNTSLSAGISGSIGSTQYHNLSIFYLEFNP